MPGAGTERPNAWPVALRGWGEWTFGTVAGGALGLIHGWMFLHIGPLLMAIVLVVAARPLLDLWPNPRPGPWVAAACAGLASAIIGGGIGVGQAIAFGRLFPGASRWSWIRASVLGALASGMLAWFGVERFGLEVPDTGDVPEPILFGLCAVLGLAQWTVLRRHSRFAWVWVPTQALAVLGVTWVTVRVLALFRGPEIFPLRTDDLFALINIMPLAYGALTGLVIVWLASHGIDSERRPGVESSVSAVGTGGQAG